MAWTKISRPGYFGKRRDETLKGYDETYGAGNWRIVWNWQGKPVDFLFACHLYEDAYFVDSFKRPELWEKLVKEGREVYDNEVANVDSGFDYEDQRSNATHIQDISIRRVVARRGWQFQGDELIQIRSHSKYWGENLSPGRVPFHLPQNIITPQLESWWGRDSVEAWYQSAKELQARVPDAGDIQALVNEAEIIEMKAKRLDQRKRIVQGQIGDMAGREFLRVLPTINSRLEGEAPVITDFKVTPKGGLDLRLDSEYEFLDGEEGDLIKQVVGEELEISGLGWIRAGFSPYYYGK